ncbi:MAG: IS66 family insertion sequence element accessory protein TnpA [Solirubrobacteraceae bacterium]
MGRTSREQWKKRVAAFADSGLTARQFAARLGVNPRTLTYWKWRLGAEAAASSSATGSAQFIELSSAVVPSDEGGDDRIEVVCIGGRVLRVGREFDRATLVRLLDALEGR